MNILVIGGTGTLINQLLRKLKKEGHRVHLLTGDRYNDSSYEKVFERYNLPYDSECLTDVFDSVNPDVTIFMGAFDTNFRWLDEQKEVVRFATSITNFLMAYTMSGKGRFIWLSSDEIYSGDYPEDISEDEPASPKSMKGMALSQAEDICRSFIKMRDYDIVTLRLDRYYRIPKAPRDVDEICSKMCLEAMRKGSVSVGSDERLSLLYESDAVEYIYQLVKCKSHMHPEYNLSTSRELKERDIAEIIRDALSDDIAVEITEDDGRTDRRILSNKRFDGEFGMRIFADDQKLITDLAKYMNAHSSEFLTGEERKKTWREKFLAGAGWFIRATVPYLENIGFFVIFFLLNTLAVSSRFFSRLDLYLLYVLLFAVVHGQQQATLSAILAVFGYFFTQMRERSLLNVVLDYNTYIWIAQLFIVGLVVGYMKDQIIKLRAETEEERKYLNRQLSDIKDINGSNVRVKDALETQIVNQSDSIGKIYAITSKLEKYTPEEVLFYAVEIVRDFLGSNDIAIYTVSNMYYARLFTFTSETARALGNSIRYRDLGELYESLSEKKVYINRTLDSRYPMMAAPIFDKDDMQTMIMAWGIPWERMTLGQADLLMIVSYLIQNAVLRATRYINMLENRRYDEGKLVMGEEAFTSLVHVFLEAKEKRLTECVLLRLIIPEGFVIPDEPKEDEASPSAAVGVIPIIAAGSTTENPPEPEAAEPAPAPVQTTVTRTVTKIEHTDGNVRAVPKIRREKGIKGLIAQLRAVTLNIHIGSLPSKEIKLPEPEEYVTETVETKPLETAPAPASAPKADKSFAAAAPVIIPKKEEAGEAAETEDERRHEAIAKGLVGKIRNTDYVGVMEDGQMYVLLCNTNRNDAASAITRIESGGYRCEIAEEVLK